VANFRQIHVSFWKDEWVLDLTLAEKGFFIYLWSNESTNLAGIYKLSKKVICFETGSSMAFTEKTLDKFQKAEKVFYEDGIVWVKNLRRYHETSSTKVQTRIKRDLETIPHCELKIAYLEYYDTLSIPYGYPMDTPPLSIRKGKGKGKELKAGEKQPANLNDWLEILRKDGNKTAVLMGMFETLYPSATEKPEFGYIGRVAKNVGGAGRLAQLLWECSSKNVTGDVMRYIQAYSKNNSHKEPKKKGPKTDPAKTLKQLEDLEKK